MSLQRKPPNQKQSRARLPTFASAPSPAPNPQRKQLATPPDEVAHATTTIVTSSAHLRDLDQNQPPLCPTSPRHDQHLPSHYEFPSRKYGFSAFLAGMKRSTGLTFKTEKVAGDNKEANKWINKYLGLGEWVMDQSVAIAGSSSFFERTR
ncbi:hypothetical protein MY11210_002889 [Beauveria gryllotalpidicola]